MDNPPALLAAVALIVVYSVHGLVGHRWFMAQLGTVEMQPTPLSKRLFGDRDVAWRVFGTAWHIVTVVFLASAVALALTAFGALESRDLVRFIGVIEVATLMVGAVYTVGGIYVEKGADVLTRPVPLLFAIGMVVATSLTWIASNSVQSP
jgi:sterol desaturase/sphingolipid hydroxylase (fatty acid hydroxylase superfamily)